MAPLITSATLRNLLLAARARPAEEICGILRGTNDVVRHAMATANVASRPADSFEIDAGALLRVHRLSRAPGGFDILGCYHSHPGGRPAPSPRDAAAAAADGRLWLILGGDTARLWRAVSQGAVHGRFDPVAFDIMTGKRVVRSVSAVAWDDDEPGSLAIEYFLD
ncbi:M67 family metallopeptidase [Stakelama saccharophila]|uniref:M67 family metallopeptidase n=1 Tax=Stakelama saccharophila TaxID=3075605 RepID=A0ABZ0B636_9SPHN|nr:M67 family metallopeptidase [Stakelama sp. W311]WNO52774.1 M67 family metallopeptidase [Stakelama sp. W311]